MEPIIVNVGPGRDVVVDRSSPSYWTGTIRVRAVGGSTDDALSEMTPVAAQALVEAIIDAVNAGR